MDYDSGSVPQLISRVLMAIALVSVVFGPALVSGIQAVSSVLSSALAK